MEEVGWNLHEICLLAAYVFYSICNCNCANTIFTPKKTCEKGLFPFVKKNQIENFAI